MLSFFNPLFFLRLIVVFLALQMIDPAIDAGFLYCGKKVIDAFSPSLGEERANDGKLYGQFCQNLIADIKISINILHIIIFF